MTIQQLIRFLNDVKIAWGRRHVPDCKNALGHESSFTISYKNLGGWPFQHTGNQHEIRGQLGNDSIPMYHLKVWRGSRRVSAREYGPLFSTKVITFAPLSDDDICPVYGETYPGNFIMDKPSLCRNTTSAFVVLPGKG